MEAQRRLRQRGSGPQTRSSRSYRSIFVANTFTVFNLILALFGAATLIFGNAKDALFLGVLVANIAIGTFQEVRAKRALDKLAALVAPRATVVRDGEPRDVPVDEVVVGDLVRVMAGDQVVADGTLVQSEGLALDESNLTGESEPVLRDVADQVAVWLVRGGGRRRVCRDRRRRRQPRRDSSRRRRARFATRALRWSGRWIGC